MSGRARPAPKVTRETSLPLSIAVPVGTSNVLGPEKLVGILKHSPPHDFERHSVDPLFRSIATSIPTYHASSRPFDTGRTDITNLNAPPTTLRSLQPPYINTSGLPTASASLTKAHSLSSGDRTAILSPYQHTITSRSSGYESTIHPPFQSSISSPPPYYDPNNTQMLDPAILLTCIPNLTATASSNFGKARSSMSLFYTPGGQQSRFLLSPSTNSTQTTASSRAETPGQDFRESSFGNDAMRNRVNTYPLKLGHNDQREAAAPPVRNPYNLQLPAHNDNKPYYNNYGNSGGENYSNGDFYGRNASNGSRCSRDSRDSSNEDEDDYLLYPPARNSYRIGRGNNLPYGLDTPSPVTPDTLYDRNFMGSPSKTFDFDSILNNNNYNKKNGNKSSQRTPGGKSGKWYNLFQRYKHKILDKSATVPPTSIGRVQIDSANYPKSNAADITYYVDDEHNNEPLNKVGNDSNRLMEVGGSETLGGDGKELSLTVPAIISMENKDEPDITGGEILTPRSPRMGSRILQGLYPDFHPINPILKSNGKYAPLIDLATTNEAPEDNPEGSEVKNDKMDAIHAGLHQRSPSKKVHIGGSPMIIPYTPPPTGSPMSPEPYNGHRHIRHKRIDEKAHEREAFRKNFYGKLSYLYALILISIGFSLPVSEAIAENFPIEYHEIYYVYLYVVSIAFFLYTWFFLIRFYTKTDLQRKASVVLMQNRKNIDTDAAKLLIKKQRVTEFESSTGSFYLRMGALVFGAGNMIYSGLQFSEFFDNTLSSNCSDYLGGLVPALNLLFTFIQTYFIFSHSKICIHKYKTLARFGLMHLVATNLCVWIITLVRQTIEEIEWFHHEIKDKGVVHSLVENVTHIIVNATGINLPDAANDSKLACTKSKRDIILSKIVEDAGPFLYPCTIEYSLICAAISYVMWKNIGEVPRFRKSRRSRNSYTVNCEGASRGLFLGLTVLVFSIITLILFFVLIERKEYFVFAVYLNQITEIMVYMAALVAIGFAFYKMRPLKFMDLRDREKLDSLLLSIAVAGEYFFSMFSIVSTLGDISHRTILLLTSSLINVIESTAQTVFIVDALNRFSITEKDENEKPGRQFVTFLIICNFALWGFNTFANERTRTNPIQIEFYGYVTWNIITHICTPLSIFYRYHSTACLAEVWKQAYKTRIDEFV